MCALRQTLYLFTILTVAIIGVSTAVKAGERVTVKPAYGGKLSFALLKPDNPKAAVVLFPAAVDIWIWIVTVTFINRRKAFWSLTAKVLWRKV